MNGQRTRFRAGPNVAVLGLGAIDRVEEEPMRVESALLVVVCVAGGCIEREGRPVAPCTQVNTRLEVAPAAVRDVDLLLMVDNSNSMQEEQTSLTREFPILMNILATGDFEQDGVLNGPNDFPPVRSLNVGVITSDMGTGGFDVPTCTNSDFGDDGILRPACSGTTPAILNFQPPGDAAAFAQEAACVATLGTGGCGFEQQLEAILKAVTPTVSQAWTAPDFVPIGTTNAPDGLDRPFFMNSQPHGDRENAGFARSDAVLAIVPVTDEEDCSAWDEDLFDPNGGPYAGEDLNLRCTTFLDALHPIQRYVAGLVQLRARPGLVLYAPITGLPLDLVPQGDGPTDWQAILDDDRLRYEVDGTGRRLVPSCAVEGLGEAYPPRRFVEVARGLENAGAHVTVQSICQESFAGALEVIIGQLRDILNTACLPRPLNSEADGRVSCDVVAVLAPDMPCDAYGAEPQLDSSGNPTFEGERAVCVLNQLVPTAPNVPTGDHWFYDTYSDQGRMSCGDPADPTVTFQRVAFTRQPPPGTTIRLECFSAVQGGDGMAIEVGTFCDPAAADVCTGGVSDTGVPLACDPIPRTCGVRCSTNADCRAAGLVGFVCDPRTLEEVDPGEFPGDTTPHQFCVNPTCD